MIHERMVAWRGVLVRRELAAALDEADFPPTIRPTGSKSGARTWAQQGELRTTRPGYAARGHSWHQAGLAVDLSPSAEIPVAALDRGGLVLPVPGEPWHVELEDHVWSDLPITCAIADLGRAWWDLPGAPYSWAIAEVRLMQGYLARLGHLSAQGIDGFVGPGTRAAIRAAGIADTLPPSEVVERLVGLAEAAS